MSDLWKKAINSKCEEDYSDHPSGNVLKELEDSELDSLAGGGTANSVCACNSGKHSCGRFCTGSTECPIMTIICC